MWGNPGMANQGAQKWGQAAGAGMRPAGFPGAAGMMAGLAQKQAQAPAPGAGAAGAPLKITVASKVPGDKTRLATILGEYVAQGNNHERKSYKKLTAIPGRPGTFAFLYYWDERDGPENSGWWFSDRVGGEEVWAFCPQKATSPPTTGWKIPWDGPVYTSLTLTHAGPAAGATPAATPLAAKPGLLGQKAPGLPGQAGAVAAKGDPATEARDLAAFKASLPAATETVTSTEAVVDSVVELAGTLSGKLDDPEDQLEAAIKEVEAKAKEAQETLGKARNQVSKMLVDARKYAPQARNTAMEEFKVLQQKVGALQVKLNPLKAPGQEIRKLKACKKIMEEVAEKLTETEGEVEKAETEARVVTNGDASNEALEKVEEALTPAQTSLMTIRKTMDTGLLKTAPAMAKNEITELQERAKKVQEKINSIKESIKEPRDRMVSEKIVAACAEKITELDEVLSQMEEAEMPFLKGIEDLPGQELDDTVEACVKASTAAFKSFNETKMFCKAKLMEAEKFVESVKDSAKSALQDVERKITSGEPKLMQFKKETAERRVKGIVATVTPKVDEAEAVLEKGKEAAKGLEILNLDDLNPEELQETAKQVNETESEGQKAVAEARNVISEKQKGGLMTQVPGLQIEMKKVMDKLAVVQKGLSGLKIAAAGVDRVLKGKEALAEADQKMDEAEKKIDDTDNLATPNGEETLPDEKVEEIIAAVEESAKLLQEAAKVAQGQAFLGKQAGPVQSSFMELLQKLNTRAKAAQTKLEGVKKSSRGWVEHYHCGKIIAELGGLVTDAEQNCEKLLESEEPFLRGIEMIPLVEAREAIEVCDAAEKGAETAVQKLQTFIGSKRQQLNTFEKETAKSALEELLEKSKGLEKLVNKVKAFKKDMVERKKNVQVQEAEAKVEEAEAEVKKGVEAAEPFKPDNTLTEDEADKECEKLLAIAKVAATKMQEAQGLVLLGQKGAVGNATRMEFVKGLHQRLKDSQAEMTKARASAGEAEVRINAKELIAQADENLKKAEDSVKGAKEAAAPATENSGVKFLSHTVLRVVVDALHEHMTEASTDAGALFKKAAGGSALSQAAFLKFVASMPSFIGWWEEMEFTEEHLVAAFKVADADGDGSISATEFESLFQKKFTVAGKVALTEGPEVKEAVTLVELEVGAIVQALEDPKTTPEGLQRVKAKAATGEVGYVTLGNRGQVFLKQHLASLDAQNEMQHSMKAKRDELNKCNTFVASKLRELTLKKEGPLVAAKEALEKVQPQLQALTKDMSELDKSVAAAKADILKRQEAFLKATRDAKGSFAASKVLGDLIKKVKKIDQSTTKIQEQASALTALEAEKLDKADPVGVLQKMETGIAELKTSAAEAKEELKVDPDLGEGDTKALAIVVKAEKFRLDKVLSSSTLKCAAAIQEVRKVCHAMTASKVEAVSNAICNVLAERKVDSKTLFNELKESDKDVITEAKLSEYFSGLKGLEISKEHTKLVFREILNDGLLSKHRFMRLVQKYYACVKDIGIAAECALDSKTQRKFKVGEILEAIGAPVELKEKGVTRVHGRCLEDGMVGWVSMKGNAGTAFLQETAKPYLVVKQTTGLFAAEKGPTEEIRALDVHEVVEVLEGPKPDQEGDILRIKAKIGAKIGYVTVKDGAGTVLCDKETKYKCKQAIAFTDGPDMKTSKVLRKIDTDELLTHLEGPVTEGGVSRVRAKAASDEIEGWITVKGNAGSVYLEELPSKTYTVKRNVPLQDKFKADSLAKTLQELKPDDVLDVLEPAKADKSEPVEKMKVCALSDDKVGWVSIRGNGLNLKPWTPKYRCMKKTDMHEDVKTDSTVVRGVDDKEALELLEGPVKEGDAIRAKCRADKDNATGWVTIGEGATTYLVGAATLSPGLQR